MTRSAIEVGTSDCAAKSQPLRLALLVSALFLTGALLLAGLFGLWHAETTNTIDRSNEQRSDASERCPAPVVEGARAYVNLGGWGEPDVCEYTQRDGTSGGEPVLAR